MWLLPLNTELEQNLYPRVNHLYHGRRWYHCCSLLLSILITLHGRVHTKNVSDKNADDTKSSKWKNAQARDIHVISQWDEKWKIQINQMKNIYQRKFIDAGILITKTSRHMLGKIIRREKYFFYNVSMSRYFKKRFKSQRSLSNYLTPLKHHTC